ncbi:MAG: aldo/keto reductase, partial [Acidobacteriota bacterium]
EKAQARGVARVALKALAYTPLRHLEVRRYQNCWYRPIEDPALALQALRFSLSEDVSAVFPPSDERLYRMVLELAPRVTPLSVEERQQLLDSAGGLKPIMKAGRKP